MRAADPDTGLAFACRFSDKLVSHQLGGPEISVVMGGRRCSSFHQIPVYIYIPSLTLFAILASLSLFSLSNPCFLLRSSSSSMVFPGEQKSLPLHPPLPIFDDDIPQQYIWPDEEKPTPDASEVLVLPVIDLHDAQTLKTVSLVREACKRHGFFQVVNHGVDPDLLSEAHRLALEFFQLPLEEKQRVQRKPGESCGYASSFTGRFTSKLPWKETLSFRYSPSSANEECGVIASYEYV